MIEENVGEILAELPDGVDVVAAAKTRTPDEVLGVKIVGRLKEASTPWAGISLPVKLFHHSGWIQWQSSARGLKQGK